MDCSAASRVPRLVLFVLAGLLALAVVVGCGGGEPSVSPTSTPVPTVVPTATLDSVQTPSEASTSTSTSEALATKVWDTAVMLAEELSPRESATEEELRAAEYLAGRFSGWGYEVGLQAVSIMTASNTAATPSHRDLRMRRFNVGVLSG